MRILLISLFIINQQVVFGQFEGNNWCFGDSVQMCFDSLNNISFKSCLTSCFEPAASISDRQGNLLMYLSLEYFQFNNQGKLFNGNHQLIPGSDSLLISQTNAFGALILPKPGNDSVYYLFHTTYYSPNYYRKLFFTEINIAGNGGAGQVISKNQQISLTSDTLTECIAAIRHGNGQDWWIVVHGSLDNLFYFYKLDSLGVAFSHIQSVGTSLLTSTPNLTSALKFSLSGHKAGLVNSGGVIEIFDFDRCSGILSNPICIDSVVNSPNEVYVSCSFSSDDSKFYVSSQSVLWQLDLSNSNPQLFPLFTVPNSFYIGHHQIGPDFKIYISFGSLSFNVNYTDTINTRLSVINHPDSLGTLCDFRPYTPYLFVGRNRRTRASLPNFANYNLGVLFNSLCDSTNFVEYRDKISYFNIYPNPVKDILYFSIGSNLGVKNISIVSMDGRSIINYKNQQTLSVVNLEFGMYFIILETNQGRFVSRFVKE